MATREDEIKDLREKNNELVQKVQYWKMTAAQREDEKLTLMKEINELRLKLSRLRSGGSARAREFDAAIQATSERALAHLVRASGEIAHSIELAKTYMRDRQELDDSSPRWSTIGGTPAEKTDRVHRVPPMMMGGQSIQPVVALSRTLFNTNNSQTASRSPNRSLTSRAVPVHVLQDVYIPLTRIDAAHRQADNSVEMDGHDAENSTEDLGLEESMERMDDSQDVSESEDYDASRRLDVVAEDIEPEDEVLTPSTRNKSENPLEGPSWLLDSPEQAQPMRCRPGTNLEPDSTTEVEEAACVSPPTDEQTEDNVRSSVSSGSTPPAGSPARVFSPTVRRKRTHSPLPSAVKSPMHRRNSNSGRVLKVLVAKMRLSSGSDQPSPPKRVASLSSPPPALARFDAPSPNGATDAALLIETHNDNIIDSMDVSPRDPIPQHSRRDSRYDIVERNAKEYKRADHSNNDTHDKPVRHDRTNRHDKSDQNTTELENRQRYSRHDKTDRHDNSDRNTNGLDNRETFNRHDRTDRHDKSDGNRSDRFVCLERGSRAGSEVSNQSSEGRDSDSDPPREGRTRRNRKPITYKEKPLNRKMRR